MTAEPEGDASAATAPSHEQRDRLGVAEQRIEELLAVQRRAAVDLEFWADQTTPAVGAALRGVAERLRNEAGFRPQDAALDRLEALVDHLSDLSERNRSAWPPLEALLQRALADRDTTQSGRDPGAVADLLREALADLSDTARVLRAQQLESRGAIEALKAAKAELAAAKADVQTTGERAKLLMALDARLVDRLTALLPDPEENDENAEADEPGVEAPRRADA